MRRGPRIVPWMPRPLLGGGDGFAGQGTQFAPQRDAAERCRIIGTGVVDARFRLRIDRLSPRDGCSSLVARLPGHLIRGQRGGRPSDLSVRQPAHSATSLHEVHLGVKYTIRPARITDIDRLAAIGRAAMTASGNGSLGAPDLLRQCVYLPHASLL